MPTGPPPAHGVNGKMHAKNLLSGETLGKKENTEQYVALQHPCEMKALRSLAPTSVLFICQDTKQ